MSEFLSTWWWRGLAAIVAAGGLVWVRSLVKKYADLLREKIETHRFVKIDAIENILDFLARKAVDWAEKEAYELVDKGGRKLDGAGKKSTAITALKAAAAKHGLSLESLDAERRVERAHADMEAGMARADFIERAHRVQAAAMLTSLSPPQPTESSEPKADSDTGEAPGA